MLTTCAPVARRSASASTWPWALLAAQASATTVTVIPRAALRNDDSEADQAAYIDLILKEHEEIVAAISGGDEDGAREAMRRHLRGSQARYRALLREQRRQTEKDV